MPVVLDLASKLMSNAAFGKNATKAVSVSSKNNRGTTGLGANLNTRLVRDLLAAIGLNSENATLQQLAGPAAVRALKEDGADVIVLGDPLESPRCRSGGEAPARPAGAATPANRAMEIYSSAGSAAAVAMYFEYK